MTKEFCKGDKVFVVCFNEIRVCKFISYWSYDKINAWVDHENSKIHTKNENIFVSEKEATKHLIEIFEEQLARRREEEEKFKIETIEKIDNLKKRAKERVYSISLHENNLLGTLRVYDSINSFKNDTRGKKCSTDLFKIEESTAVIHDHDKTLFVSTNLLNLKDSVINEIDLHNSRKRKLNTDYLSKVCKEHGVE